MNGIPGNGLSLGTAIGRMEAKMDGIIHTQIRQEVTLQRVATQVDHVHAHTQAASTVPDTTDQTILTFVGSIKSILQITVVVIVLTLSLVGQVNVEWLRGAIKWLFL